MTQPTSFTEPPSSRDEPALPDRCSDCNGFLPGAHAWQYEDDYEDDEDDGRWYQIHVIVWTFACKRCGAINKKTVTA